MPTVPDVRLGLLRETSVKSESAIPAATEQTKALNHSREHVPTVHLSIGS
jgi:hypothetical protein